MERKSPLTLNRLNEIWGERLPYASFYRFMQWLEQYDPQLPPIGSTSQLSDDPVRLRPHPGMGFPASELKSAELNPDDNPDSPPTIRTTFFGLYGITSPLPTFWIDDIVQQREGHEAVEHFLDIFNHRMLTQFYRIWRKYSYPATFEPGGTDAISQCLLSLAGLGIPGTAEHLSTPLSRFLALPALLRQPGRTADGLRAVVRLVTQSTHAVIVPHYRCRVKTPQSRLRIRPALNSHPRLGSYATDINSTLEIRLYTENRDDARGWLPPHQPLYHDLLSLLRVYLGWRYNARITLTMPRRLFPMSCLSSKAGGESPAYLGYSFLLRQEKEHDEPSNPKRPDRLTVKLGWYKGLACNPVERIVTEVNETL